MTRFVRITVELFSATANVEMSKRLMSADVFILLERKNKVKENSLGPQPCFQYIWHQF